MKKTMILLLLAAYHLPVSAQDKKAVKQAQQMAAALIKTAGLPGLSVAVLQNDKIIYTEGLGYADVEKRIPVTTQTRFRTASVGKVITATGLARLLQDGKIDLDAPVQRYVPGFPGKKYRITIRQLAGHLSGLPHYNENDRIQKRYYPTIRDGLSVFSHEALLNEPGTVYHYSTHGYTLLSAAIEGASGTDFISYLRRQIFRPLGMKSTRAERRGRPSKYDAALYDMEDEVPVKEKDPEDPSYKVAGGGMRSTPTDLVRMASSYFNGFLQQAIVDTLFKSQALKSGEKTMIGIGWRQSRDVDNRTVYDHAGSMGGARSVISIYPADRLAVAVMTNAGWPSMIEETAQMFALSFLSKNERKQLPSGTFKLFVKVPDGNDEPAKYQGILTIDQDSILLITDAGFKEKKTTHLFYLGGNRFAWVRPDAICYMEMEWKDKKIWGKAIAYGSRLDHNPASNPPFLSFTSVE